MAPIIPKVPRSIPITPDLSCSHSELLNAAETELGAMEQQREVYMVKRRVNQAGGQLADIDPNFGHWGVDVRIPAAISNPY